MKKRVALLILLVLVMAVVAPSSAMAYSWKRSPVNPLIKGGVHTEADFAKLLTTSTKARSAFKRVIRADGYPSWVFSAAVAQAAAGDIHSASLAPGTKIGAMAFGIKVTRIVKNTTWAGNGRLPYYYVRASKTTTEGAFLVTRTYRVAASKTCANPFVLPGSTTRRSILRRLFVEKRAQGQLNLLAGWHITGTVGGKAIDVTTSATEATLVGEFAPGTAYDLSEVIPADSGWIPISPEGGRYAGTMPAEDLTLTYVNGLD
jgi:hypothetical protein